MESGKSFLWKSWQINEIPSSQRTYHGSVATGLRHEYGDLSKLMTVPWIIKADIKLAPDTFCHRLDKECKKNKNTENTWIDNFSWKIKLTLFLLVIFMLNFVKYLPLKFALFIWTFIMFSVIIYLWWFSYKEAKGNKFYKRTKKGRELNKKLEGLKR